MNFVEIDALPQYVMIVGILLGLCLAAINPRLLFFVVFAGLVMGDWRAFAHSRLAATGGYLNIFDLLIVFGLISALLQIRANGHSITYLWYLVLADLAVGYLISYVQMGFNFDVLRQARAALNVPLLWFMGYHCINSREDARIVIHIVLYGCFVQALRQCYFVAFFDDLDAREAAWRTIRFMNVGNVFIPLCFLMHSAHAGRVFRYFLYAHIALSIVALILTQTRSFWIPQMALIAVGAWTMPRARLAKFLLITTGAVLLAGLAFTVLAPNKVNLLDLFFKGRATDFSSGTGREETIYYELKAWLDGNLVLGEGIGFYNLNKYVNLGDVAWGHNGYSDYLANLGLLGFILFGVSMPRLGLARARVLRKSFSVDTQLFGSLARGLIWIQIMESALSGGVLYGLAYTLNLIFLGGACSVANILEDGESEATALASLGESAAA